MSQAQTVIKVTPASLGTVIAWLSEVHTPITNCNPME